jgi:hypothetical protein
MLLMVRPWAGPSFTLHQVGAVSPLITATCTDLRRFAFIYSSFRSFMFIS